MSELKHTPIFAGYSEFGGKTIDFGGWELPVQFSGIKEEHQAVREAAGLFDVSHMGEITVRGNDALPFLQKLLSNDLSKMSDNQAQYNIMCYEDGGCVDDLIVYRHSETNYLLVVNASNTEKDYQWLASHADAFDVTVKNVSDEYGQIAIQGPHAVTIVQRYADRPIDDMKPFYFDGNVMIEGHQVIVSRTGYTGEDGFEIYMNSEAALELWQFFARLDDVKPIGLGARDTLRFEAALSLYGQEISETISPLEAGLGFAVKLDKEPQFIGQQALIDQKATGKMRRIIGLELVDKGVPRHGYPVLKDGVEVGVVTTGTQSPTLGKSIALALVNHDVFKEETFEIQVRKRLLNAVKVPKTFYKRSR
ncbi:glycine cleavage system aminomethyltransferase GcvT [Brochothrix thermosphacta]|uniref:glycine cleavage system aminomethyltransferase GcvT n=1 Tax=Brochothrix thermosphacta TaxID=2756 RepID=UPI0039AF5C40